MVESNTQRAVEWLSAWARYDYPAFRALTHDDVRSQVLSPGAKLNGFNDLVGGDRLAETLTGETMIKSPRFPFTTMQWTADHTVAEGEKVFVDASLDAGLKAGGRYANRYWFLITFHDGRVIDVIEVPTDGLAQLTALGYEFSVKAPA